MKKMYCYGYYQASAKWIGENDDEEVATRDNHNTVNTTTVLRTPQWNQRGLKKKKHAELVRSSFSNLLKFLKSIETDDILNQIAI